MRRLVALPLTCLIAACGGQGSNTSPSGAITLTSDAFADGGNLPAHFTCDGAGTSPPLRWSGVPPRAAELVLTLRDPDAPGGTFTHWLLFDVEPTTSSLAEASVPPGARQGRTSAGSDGYTPACPPHGSQHHYVFTLTALSSPSGLAPGASSADVDAAVTAKAIASGTLVALYAR